MSEEKMAQMFNTVGQHIAVILDGEPNDSYMYAEAADGSVEAGIFQDRGHEVIYYDPSNELFDELQELWYAAERGKKWGALHYYIKGGKFDARFEYPEDWGPDEYSWDRRERALRERYGDKPVVYPPPDNGFYELSEADLS